MDKYELQKRTKTFALSIIRFCELMPKTDVGKIILRQLVRSATSVAANYRAACRARSRDEFIAKLGIVIEEADESVFWLEMISESGLLKAALVAPLLKEANEVTAIMVSSTKSARQNINQKSAI